MKHLLSLPLLAGHTCSSLAQGRLRLQHQKRALKQKDFPTEKTFSFKINDSTYHFGQVSGFDRQFITITYSDSVSAKARINDIEIITIDRVANQRWMEPFAFFLIAAGMFIAATPVIWDVGSGDKALEGLDFAGILAAVSVPPLRYGSHREQYNLKRKWRLVVE